MKKQEESGNFLGRWRYVLGTVCFGFQCERCRDSCKKAISSIRIISLLLEPNILEKRNVRRNSDQ